MRLFLSELVPIVYCRVVDVGVDGVDDWREVWVVFRQKSLVPEIDFPLEGASDLLQLFRQRKAVAEEGLGRVCRHLVEGDVSLWA